MSQYPDRASALRAVLELAPELGAALDALCDSAPESGASAAIVTRHTVLRAMNAFTQGSISAALLERWAEDLHTAEDVELDPDDRDYLSDALFMLSTPELLGPMEEVVAGLLARDEGVVEDSDPHPSDRAGVATASGLRRRESDDGWELTVLDGGVQVIVDYALTISTTDGHSFRIEGPMVFTDAEATDHHLVPGGDPTRLAPALAVVRTCLREARALDDGRLELSFEDGSEIRVPSDEDFEPWGATGPDGLKLVSVPGGGLAKWG